MASGLAEKMDKSMSVDFNPRQALHDIWQVVVAANKYVEESKPWVLAKDEKKQDELKSFMYTLLEAIRIIGVSLSPFMPHTSTAILASVGAPEVSRESLSTWGLLASGVTITKGSPLFQKIKDED